jgi:hypothetical protein
MRSLVGRSVGRNLVGDGDDAACRDIIGGGEETILGFRVPRKRKELLASGGGGGRSWQ